MWHESALRFGTASNAPRVVALAVVALIVASCSMAETSVIDVDPRASLGCRTQAGAYFLSKSYLTIKVVEALSNAQPLDPPMYLINEGIYVQPRPDPGFPFCLDYLSSVTSNDTLIVEKKDQLLAKITSSADDKSADIAKNLISAIFIGASQNPNFNQTLRSALQNVSFVPRFEAEFDPFDAEDTARANSGLKDFGFCLLLQYDGAQIDPTRQNVNSYCDEPLNYISGGKLKWYGLPPLGAETVERLDEAGAAHEQRLSPHADGIFYRPRLPYTAFLFTKPNPQAEGGWLLSGNDTALLENHSPIIRVGVERTYFAKRDTTLAFDQGVLRDVTIKKDSELAGFATIPLQLAQSIAALPANIVQVKIQHTNNMTQLINAQNDLITANNQLKALQLQQAAEAANVAGPEGGVRSSIRDTAAVGMSDSSGAGESLARSSISQSTSGATTSANAFAGCLAQCLKGGKEALCNKFCTCVTTTCQDGTEASCRATCTRQFD